MPPFLIGAALGGAAMFFFDPDRGRRRRALVRDKAVGASNSARNFVDAGARDLKSRGSAMTGRFKSLFNRRSATDHVLGERVRSVMGHHVAHPGAIDVYTSGGNVTLNGSILSHEHSDLVEAIRATAGVTAVVDHLSIYETAEGISELQGGRTLDDPAIRRRIWGPGPQLAAAAAVGLLLLRSSSKARGLLYLATAGAALARLTPAERLQHLKDDVVPSGLDARQEADAARTTAEEIS